jgi:hypothetical protein
VVGDIKKNQLDKQRQKETNALDLMQNTNFAYHSESLIEMQILCSALIYYYTERKLFEQGTLLSEFIKVGSSELILVTLNFEHIFSYFCAFFREYDIKYNGNVDINGIKRAKNESKLGSLQFFIACLIIGFAINHYLESENLTLF